MGNAKTQRPALEMWGGIEGTVDRVGDRYFDQFVRLHEKLNNFFSRAMQIFASLSARKS
jgi:hypothetical protein